MVVIRSARGADGSRSVVRALNQVNNPRWALRADLYRGRGNHARPYAAGGRS